MRIGINDLDRDLIKKINKFDELELNYSKDDGNILMYDGENYYTSKINVKNKEVYFTENDLIEYRKHLYKSEGKFISSFDTKLLNNNVFSSSFRTLLSSSEPKVLCRTDASVLYMKEYGSYYYVYTLSGKLYKINKIATNTQTVYDICALLKTHFACTNLHPKMITDFIPYEDGYLFAVLGYGIYYININQGIYELKFNYASVIKMAEVANNILVTITKDNDKTVILSNLINGKKIESYNILSLNYQHPKGIQVLPNKDFIVIGESNGLMNTSNIIHYWKLDEAKTSYTNIDFLLSDNNKSIYYEPKFWNVHNNKFYILGTYKSRIFAWSWDLNNIMDNPIEVFYDKIPVNFDNFYSYKFVPNGIYFIIGNKMVKYDLDFNISENIILNDFLTTHTVVSLEDSSFIAIDKKDVVLYPFQVYSYYPELSFKIYDKQEKCNNINIYIKSTEGKENIAFFNMTTGEQIIPDFYGLTEEKEFLISIKNSNAIKINMNIDMKKDSNILGIIINYNQEYYKE